MTCLHDGPCRKLLAIGKRGPAFEPWRRTRVWIGRAAVKVVRFATTEVRR